MAASLAESAKTMAGRVSDGETGRSRPRTWRNGSANGAGPAAFNGT